MLLEKKEATHPKGVIVLDDLKAHIPKLSFFSGHLSVLQALQNLKNKELDTLVSSLATLQQSTERTVIQWTPYHRNITGNEEADRLAKDGWKLQQDQSEITFEEDHSERETEEKVASATDLLQQTGCIPPPYQRRDHVITARLKTGHCRLRRHMFTKLHTCHFAEWH